MAVVTFCTLAPGCCCERCVSKSLVNHPSHYGGSTNTYETIKVIEAWGLNKSFNLGNCVKYISRAGKKDPGKLLEDLQKALWYLEREISSIKKGMECSPQQSTTKQDQS